MAQRHEMIGDDRARSRDTNFAPALRSEPEELAAKICMVSQSPVVSGLLETVGGLLAVVDENRQIVALNESIMTMLGIDDPAEALGLRPGELLGCVHADGGPSGCGTTKWFSSCGAAVAMVTSLGQNRQAERMCANGKRIVIQRAVPEIFLCTDQCLVEQVLCNMVLNALEASEEGGTMRVWVEREEEQLIFCVWNRQEIPASVACRLFQRNFSTKDQPGRGIGTHSMKLLGEHFLGGLVRFTTSVENGTVFRLSLPISSRVLQSSSDAE